MITPRLDPRLLWGWLRERVDRRRLKRWGGYVLYGVGLTALLLYVQFPTDKLKARIEAEFDAHLPAHLIVDSARIAFGPALRLEGVAVQSVGGTSQHQLLEANRVILRPSLLTLLGGAPRIDYKILLAGGSASGRLAFPEAGAKGVKLTSRIEKVAMKRGALFKELTGLEMSGLLAGRLEAELGESLAASQGKLELEVSGGRIVGIDLEALPIEAARFKRLKFECELGSRKLTLRRADISGGDFNNKLSGVVELADDLMESKLHLRGTLGLSEYLAKMEAAEGEQAPAKGGLAYVISGTLAAPRFSVDLTGGRGD